MLQLRWLLTAPNLFSPAMQQPQMCLQQQQQRAAMLHHALPKRRTIRVIWRRMHCSWRACR